MTWLVLALGAVAGCGVLLVARGVVATATPLESLVAELHRPRRPDSAGARAASMLISVAGPDSPRRQADLAVCDRTVAKFAQDRLTWALLGALPAVAVAAVISAGGGVSVPPLLVAVAGVAGGLAGWVWAGADLHVDAERTRRQFRHTLGCYLELVTILIAGGRGVESALWDAVEIGQGDAFRQLRTALTAAQARRQPPWRAFGDLGRRLQVPGLEELEATMTLAGESGARVRDSLIAKAQALRVRDLGELESEAQRRSETMVFPVTAMFAGFLILIGFPALAALSGP